MSPARDGRLGFGVIGTGKAGVVVGAALRAAGHRMTGITAGSDLDRIDALLPDVPVLDTDEVVRRSELVVLAVPSDQLAGLVAGLADVGAWQPGQLVMHIDPRFGIDVLAPALRAGAIPLAVHPAITFTGTSIDLRQLTEAYAAVTAPGPVLPIAQALAVELGCEPVVLAEADRAAYGEAIATATQFSRSIVLQASSLLAGIGVDNPGGFLSSLVRSSVDQALADGAAAAGAVGPAATIDG